MRSGIDVFHEIWNEIESHGNREEFEEMEKTLDTFNAVQKGVLYRTLLSAAYPDWVNFSAEELLILYSGVKSLTEEQGKLMSILICYAKAMYAD